jgi:glycosyltransferase involved in cell wall biosynthesis
MNIALAGPVLPSAFREFLDADSGRRAQTLPGLGGTPVVLLGQALLRRGHRLTIVSLDRSVSDEVVLNGDRLRICVGPYRQRGRARDGFRVERDYVRRAIERESCDVVHAHWTYEFALGALDGGAPTLVTAHDAPLRILWMQRDLYRVVRTVMAWRTLRRAEHLSAVSPYVADHLRSVFRFRRDIRVIPNGFPESIFQLGRARPSRQAGPVTFATVLPGWGRLKNGHTAILAFQKLRERHPAARLLMFGQDYGASEVAAVWAAGQGAADGIEFVGRLPHDDLLRRLAADVDVLVHPSLEEAHPMAVCEAMALRIPVIGGSRSGGVPWTLEEGAVGSLVDVKSPDAIARAMATLAADPRCRERLGTLGHDSARRRFHIDAVVSLYEAAYRDVVATATKPAPLQGAPALVAAAGKGAA